MDFTAVLLKEFQALQASRVMTYRSFDDGFQAYLSAAPNYDFEKYRQLVHEITEEFRILSLSIIEIRNQLSASAPLLAEYIGRIQALEQTKLDQTAQLQIARQNTVDHPDDASHHGTVETLKHQLQKTTDNINDQLDELKYEAEDILCSAAAS
jgi:hypothetical protein